jgi:hypothetical protein
MNSPRYEDLAWLQVQEVPRGAEDGRLMAAAGRLARMAIRTAKLGLWAVRALAVFVVRRAGARPPTSSVAESRHHA